MKDQFPGYFTPSDDEFKEFWDSALIVLDANVLLDLYRYSSDTSDQLLQSLAGLSDRLWLPHQVALEFSRNRPEVIIDQQLAYARVEKYLEGKHKELETGIASELGSRFHPYMDSKKLSKPLRKAMNKINKELRNMHKSHPDLMVNDPILSSIQSLFEDKIGPPYDEAKLEDIFKTGEKRYAAKVPPGYADRGKKQGNDIYGDFVIWRQVLDQAKASGRPILFVTNDSKEDWWWKVKGRTLGPRPDMVEEMMKEAGSQFHAYTSDQFLQFAENYLNVTVKEETVVEVREFRERDAERAVQSELELMSRNDPAYFNDAIHAEFAHTMNEMERIRRATDPAYMTGPERAHYFRMMNEMERRRRATDPAYMDEAERNQYRRMMDEMERRRRATDPAYMDEAERNRYRRMMDEIESIRRATNLAYDVPTHQSGGESQSNEEGDIQETDDGSTT